MTIKIIDFIDVCIVAVITAVLYGVSAILPIDSFGIFCVGEVAGIFALLFVIYKRFYEVVNRIAE